MTYSKPSKQKDITIKVTVQWVQYVAANGRVVRATANSAKFLDEIIPENQPKNKTAPTNISNPSKSNAVPLLRGKTMEDTPTAPMIHIQLHDVNDVMQFYADAIKNILNKTATSVGIELTKCMTLLRQLKTNYKMRVTDTSTVYIYVGTKGVIRISNHPRNKRRLYYNYCCIDPLNPFHKAVPYIKALVLDSQKG